MFAKPLLTIALILLTSVAYGDENREDFEGSMDCKVVDQTIVDINDGRTKTYQFFNDEFKVGDQLSFTYSAQNILNWPPQFKIKLIDPMRKEPNGRQQTVGNFFSGKLENVLVGNLLSAALSSTDIKIALSEEAIYAQNRFSTLTLKRYYKNDWEGQFVRWYYLDMTAAQIVSLDCRHKDDQLDELVKRSKKQITKAMVADMKRKKETTNK